MANRFILRALLSEITSLSIYCFAAISLSDHLISLMACLLAGIGCIIYHAGEAVVAYALTGQRAT